LGFAKSLEKTKDRIQKYGLSIPWVGYHDPNLGSLVATAYGILGFTYKRFFTLTILPVICWCSLWGILAYILGMNALKLMGYEALIVIICIWIIARFIEIKIEERRSKINGPAVKFTAGP
jgi:membrane protein DedA with SNARE-associated domain